MFDLVKIDEGRINQPEPVFLPVGSVAVVKGEALVIGSDLTGSGGADDTGKLVACGATDVPRYIAMADGAIGAIVPVCKVRETMLFEVPVSASPASLVIGDKVTIHSDALKVTATTTAGVATIVDKREAAASGDLVHVRFEIPDAVAAADAALATAIAGKADKV